MSRNPVEIQYCLTDGERCDFAHPRHCKFSSNHRKHPADSNLEGVIDKSTDSFYWFALFPLKWPCGLLLVLSGQKSGNEKENIV